MKKVLIITDTFPPYKHIGRFRIQQFAKYLTDFGWEPIILTPTSSYLWEKDDSLLKEIPPNLRVYRPFMPPTLPAMLRNIKESIRKKDQTEKEKISSNKSIRPSSKKTGIKAFLSNCINSYTRFVNKHILIPGSQILWLPFAVIKGIKIIRRFDVDVIFSSVPVYSNHIVAYFLKIITRKSWVSDYRDLWTNDVTRRKRFTSFRNNFERVIEKELLQNMDCITFISSQMIPVISSEFPDISFRNTAIITNGFDPEMMSGLTVKYIKGEYFNILYTGRITPHRHHNLFLPSVGKLISANADLKRDLKLVFIGQILEQEKVHFDKIVNNYSMQKNIIISSWLAHQEILMRQRQADILLLIVDDVKFANVMLPGKVFEYIVSKRPILTLAPEGDTKTTIEKTRTGFVVPPKNEEMIQKAILHYYQLWENNQLFINPDWKEINKFNRVNLTKKLANLLNTIVQNS